MSLGSSRKSLTCADVHALLLAGTSRSALEAQACAERLPSTCLLKEAALHPEVAAEVDNVVALHRFPHPVQIE